ncbi:hypothetical protein KCP70_14995 [Salmonella enterica subsp. enterica]|nr:hypothetical protein KCP70_14995 [Salmonella enterica subsp. enterica]
MRWLVTGPEFCLHRVITECDALRRRSADIHHLLSDCRAGRERCSAGRINASRARTVNS